MVISVEPNLQLFRWVFEGAGEDPFAAQGLQREFVGPLTVPHSLHHTHTHLHHKVRGTKWRISLVSEPLREDRERWPTSGRACTRQHFAVPVGRSGNERALS